MSEHKPWTTSNTREGRETRTNLEQVRAACEAISWDASGDEGVFVGRREQAVAQLALAMLNGDKHLAIEWDESIARCAAELRGGKAE